MNERTETDFSTFLLESLGCGDPYLRRNFIGASDAPVIMGLSPWRTPLQLYNEKLGLIAPQIDNVRMAEGRRKESVAREKFEELMGESFSPKRMFASIPEFMMASLDGMNTDGKIIVEIKCPGEDSYWKSKRDGVPEMYYCQIQHQLYVSGADFAYYFCYLNDDEHHYVKVTWNNEYIEKLMQKETEFWNCIKEMKEPKLTDKDYVQSDNFVLSLLSHALARNRAMEKEYKRLCQEIEEQIVKEVDGKNTKGFGLTVRKVIRQGSIDYSRVEEISDIDLEKYRKESSEYWKITIED